MSLDMERLIPVNFATVEGLQRIPHVDPKIACAIITLRESHGNLTLDTLQTFLRVKFNAETLEMLDFTRNVGFSTSCPLCLSFVLFVLFFLFVVVVSGEPKQKQGRGLVDHKLVQAPQ